VAGVTITYHDAFDQGSEQWLAARRGLLTASEMKLIMTPTGKPANNDKSRAHVYEIAAQRISGHVEPHYISDDMLRGHEDEIEARALYAKHYAPVREVGFVTNSSFGFTIGYSPDGIIDDAGLIEAKSRRQKFQIQTIASNAVPEEHVLQCQTGLLVTGRQWLDFISYSGGLPMAVIRVEPDPDMHDAIIAAATAFEAQVAAVIDTYHANVARHGFIATERKIEQEIF
jgi:predicted phage-related endonuclease